MRKSLFVLLAALCSSGLWAQNARDSVDKSQVQIGYTQVSSRTIAGAVNKVDAQLMRKGLITSSLDALSGQAAGVQVQTWGDPEAMVRAVRVRGTTSLTGGNDPLVIIDGVASDLATLATIYPADIESFTILKDASQTAQYGSRGAAGVIEVATKKGKGGKFHISYDCNLGFETVAKNLDMLSGDGFRQAAKMMNIDVIDMGYSTDFRDAITRTGAVHNHHVAFGGGTDTNNYRASFGYMHHKMVVETHDMQNYFAKLDVSQKAFDNRVSFDIGVFGSINKVNRLPFSRDLFYSAAAFNPTFPKERNQEGKYDQVTEALWISNPMAMLQMDDDGNNSYLNAHLKAQVNLGWGVTLTAFGSYSYSSDEDAHYYPTYAWDNGEAYRADAKKEVMLGNFSLEKTFKMGASSLNLMALGERQTTKEKGFHVTASSFSTDEFGYHNLAAGAIRLWEGTGSFYQDSHLESFLFMAKYGFRDRLSFTVNARADGSSKVGKNNRWGFFPSVSGSWIVWDKDKMGKGKSGFWLDFINILQLRAGYGLSGNLGGIDAYNSMQLMKPQGVITLKGEPVTTLSFIRNANPDLKWEVKRTINLGVNASFWNRRIMLSLDFYRSVTDDMLYMYNVPVPPFTYNKILANLGSMKNSGFEIGFGINPLRTNDMELNVGLNMSFERNKLISLDGDFNGQYLSAPTSRGLASLSGAGYHGSSDVVKQIVGQPLGVFNLKHCIGLTTDANGSKHYEVTDESYICGQAMPKMRLGSNISFRYKKWDVSVQVNGAFGHHIFNGTALTYMNMLSLPNYNVMEGAPEMNIQDQTISDYWLERGDYVNVDYVTLGWNVPAKSKYIQSLRLSLSVNNLCTITGYSGLTPMINSSVVNSTLGLDDKNTYPVYRTFSMGLNVKF